MSIDDVERDMERLNDVGGPGSIIKTGPTKPKQPILKDPWIHRSKRMKCKTCMWFVYKKIATPTAIGRCRRHAPTMDGYPVVFDADWCGDHKLDENKDTLNF